MIFVFSLLVANILILSYPTKQSLGSSELLIVHPTQVKFEDGLYNAYSLKQHPLSVLAIIQNTSNETREYLIVLEIRKLSDGITVFLELGLAVTGAKEDEYMYFPWTPEEAGEYQVRTFLISDLVHPQILSSVIMSETSVYDNSFKGLIQMRKGACDGECPEYRVEIYQNRTAIFEGGGYVAKPGRYVFEVSQDQIDQLIDAFYNADFFSLNDNYPQISLGAPSMQLTINIDDTRKEVSHHYEGGVPDKLIELENTIDEILNTKKWVHGE